MYESMVSTSREPEGVDQQLQDDVAELVQSMIAAWPEEDVYLYPQKLMRLLELGVCGFLRTSFAPWNWEGWDEDDPDSPFTQDAVEHSWSRLLATLEACTDLSPEQVGVFAREMLDVLDMGEDFETPGGFVLSLRDIDQMLGLGLAQIDGFEDKAHQFLVALLATLLVDDGKLSGRRLSS